MQIALIATEDLIKELDKRFDHWIFSGCKVLQEEPPKTFTMRKWNGNPATCSGLASMIGIAIFDDHIQGNELDSGKISGGL